MTVILTPHVKKTPHTRSAMQSMIEGLIKG